MIYRKNKIKCIQHIDNDCLAQQVESFINQNKYKIIQLNYVYNSDIKIYMCFIHYKGLYELDDEDMFQ